MVVVDVVGGLSQPIEGAGAGAFGLLRFFGGVFCATVWVTFLENGIMGSPESFIALAMGNWSSRAKAPSPMYEPVSILGVDCFTPGLSTVLPSSRNDHGIRTLPPRWLWSRPCSYCGTWIRVCARESCGFESQGMFKNRVCCAWERPRAFRATADCAAAVSQGMWTLRVFSLNIIVAGFASATTAAASSLFCSAFRRGMP